jgi:purine nucleosidase
VEPQPKPLPLPQPAICASAGDIAGKTVAPIKHSDKIPNAALQVRTFMKATDKVDLALIPRAIVEEDVPKSCSQAQTASLIGNLYHRREHDRHEHLGSDISLSAEIGRPLSPVQQAAFAVQLLRARQLDNSKRAELTVSYSKQRVELQPARPFPRVEPRSRPCKILSLTVCCLILSLFNAGRMVLAAPIPGSRTQASGAQPEKIIIDTDIGDDIDDAFAVALALRSKEVQILGISTAFGDTTLRAELVDRFLGEAGREDIPVAIGIPTQPKTTFTQNVYAERGRFARPSHPNAVDFILGQIKQHPGEITLVCIGPLVNVGAAIEKDPATFGQLKRVVMMGGSVNRGYGTPYAAPTPPEPEWNIMNDIPAAQKLFAAGVPIYMMPLDSTQLKMDETKRDFLFRKGTPLTEALSALYFEWGQQTPTLFDPMTIAFIDDPELCPVQPMHIEVDDKGMTRSAPGAPNARVCLHSDPEAFFRFYLSQFTAGPKAGQGSEP